MKPLPSKQALAKAAEDIESPAHAWQPLPLPAAAPERPKMYLHLDLSKTKELPREQTEQQLRAEKLKRYETECTKINDFMYVGGIKVAQVSAFTLVCVCM